MTTMQTAVQGYSHLAIVVDDLEAAREFYCDLLGFEALPRPDFGLPGMWLRVGDLQLHFIENAEMPVPGPGVPHFALYVPTDQLPETVDALRGKGVTVVRDATSREDFGRTVWAAFVKDPAGNLIELTDVGPLPVAS